MLASRKAVEALRSNFAVNAPRLCISRTNSLVVLGKKHSNKHQKSVPQAKQVSVETAPVVVVTPPEPVQTEPEAVAAPASVATPEHTPAVETPISAESTPVVEAAAPPAPAPEPVVEEAAPTPEPVAAVVDTPAPVEAAAPAAAETTVQEPVPEPVVAETTTTTAQTSSPAASTPAEAPAAAAAPSSGGEKPMKDDVKGAMLEPSVVNTSQVRSAAMFGAVAVAAASSALLPSRLVAFTHVVAYALWLGANIWNTFFVGLTMFKHMPRQTFGRVQAALFPKYFGLTTGANIVLLATLAFASKQGGTGPAIASLALALVCSVANAMVVEPKATKIMFQRYDLENKEKKDENDKAQIAVLYKEFGKWHGISSLLNLVIVCVALAYGWFLAGAFVV